MDCHEKKQLSQAWCYTTVILALGKLRKRSVSLKTAWATYEDIVSKTNKQKVRLSGSPRRRSLVNSSTAWATLLFLVWPEQRA